MSNVNISDIIDNSMMNSGEIAGLRVYFITGRQKAVGYIIWKL